MVIDAKEQGESVGKEPFKIIAKFHDVLELRFKSDVLEIHARAIQLIQRTAVRELLLSSAINNVEKLVESDVVLNRRM
jgi:hypothetical protein